jgi:HEAT repeat protein
MRCKSLAIALIFCAVPLCAQQNPARTVSLEGSNGVPRVVNGTLTQRALNGSLSSSMADVARSTDTKVWAGYAIPAVVVKPGLFSYSDCCSDCALENSGNRNFTSDRLPVGRISLDLFVFVRFERGQVTRVRHLSSDCSIDATGTSVQWLTGVPPGESISYLLSLVTPDNARSFSSEAIAAIALHADPAADIALEKLFSPGQPRLLREQAAFWMAAEGSPHAVDVLRKAAREDMDAAFRRSLTFPLSIASGDAGAQELIRMAHDDTDPGVRGQALFWMAQKAGTRIAGEIAASLENDPDTEVKKRAVFALSQMPNGEGVPKLIEVARTHSNRAVRQQAVFWLGQSRDQRALSFIENILTH